MILLFLLLFTSWLIFEKLILLILLNLLSSLNLLLLSDPKLLLLLNYSFEISLFFFHYYNYKMEASTFTKLAELKLHKNVDRLLPYKEDTYLAATYHLNKETKEKTGSL